MAAKKNGSGATKSASGAAGKSVAAAGQPGTHAAEGPASGMTKWEAVKRALAALGRDAKPLAIQSHVRDRYNIQMSAGHISTYKKKLGKKRAVSTRAPQKTAAAPRLAPANGRPRAGRRAAPAAAANPADRAHGLESDAVRIRDVLLTKELLDRVGPGRLRVLIDGLTK
jgi:hypothetical protein